MTVISPIGDPASGWTANFTGGANAVRASVDLRTALHVGETVTSTILYASTPGTMSWTVNGTRLHDSVLDPGYSNQVDLRTIYMAYDMGQVGRSDGPIVVEGRLGFGKFGYLDQWCKCGSGSFGHMGNGECAVGTKCRPLSAQIVVTTSTGRILSSGTGSSDIYELHQGRIVTSYISLASWVGRSDGAPLVYSHLYHGEIYDATAETGGPPFVPLEPWDGIEMGPLSPHSFPSIRPSEEAVPAVAAWIPQPNASSGGAFSVVLDFGSNFAGACELQLEGPTAGLRGKHVNMRYGEALVSGEDGEQDVFHPWWPCRETTTSIRGGGGTQGNHNCANQTDRYIVRGAAGAIGAMTALGKVPMRSSRIIHSSTPTDTNAERYLPSHSLKGARWVQVNGTAVTKSMRFGLPTGDACVPPGGTGHLTPCTAPRGSGEVVMTLKFWPLHSDVAVRGSARLVPKKSEDHHAGGEEATSSEGWSTHNLNELHASIVRTQLNNLHSIPQDCPHREQRGWGGDAQVLEYVCGENHLVRNAV